MNYNQLVKAIGSASQQLLGRAAFAVNQALVIRNWLVGAYIVEFEQLGEDRAGYGERLLARLSRDLSQRGVKGVSRDMLERMRQFFMVYPQFGSEISAPLVRKLDRQLPQAIREISAPPVRKSAQGLFLPSKLLLHFSWSQIIELIRIDDPLKRAFYENQCLKGNWSKRQLQRQMGSLLFERTGLSRNKKALVARANRQEHLQTIEDLIRDPYVLEFTGLSERPEYTETDLEKALLDHLQHFLLELGAGFLFEARQRRITVGNEHDYIDLVFYHRHLRCHVLLDLKIRAFRHGDAGQMNFYLNWWRQNVTARGEQPPVGVILCSDKDHTKVQFATAGMDNKLFVSRYLTALPSVEQLQRFVETDRDRLEAAMKQHTPARRRRSSAAGQQRRSKTRKLRP